MPDIILKADINECKVANWQTNTGEVNVRELKVEMCEDLSNSEKQFVTFELADGTVYESKVNDGKAEIPEFTESQYIKVGLFTENINGDECEKRYSPHPDTVLVNVGSYKDGSVKPPKPTPGDYAELLEQIADLEKGTIKELDEPVNLWELETGIYHFTDNFFYTDENIVFCQDGYAVVTIDSLHNNRRNFRVFTNDGKVYCGYSESHTISTSDGIQTIVTGEIDTISDAVKEYVDKLIENIESGGSDYILPIGGNELGGVKNGGNVVINEDGTMTAPESEVTNEQVSSAVSEYLEANPDKVTTVQDGSITQEKFSDELVTKLGLEPNHHLTEVKLTLRMGKYNNFWDGVNSGTSTSTELFETPQYIKIVNNHTQDIRAAGIRFADILDYENANFISGIHQGGYLQDTIPMGGEMIFPTFEWGSKSRKYIQLYFQPSAQYYQAPNNIEVYAIYDTWKPTYKIPNDEESKEIFLEDLPMKWVVSAQTSATWSGVFCAVPYYPDFTYHIRGGCYGTILMNTLSVYGIYDDISVFDTPPKSLLSNVNAFDLSKLYGKTTQYDTSVNGGVDANYQWAYFKTPTEEELTGLKWLLIYFSQETDSNGAYVKGKDITEEYVNYVFENSTLFNGKSQYQYISRWQDKDAPRKHTTLLRKINPNLNDDGSIYQSFNTLNEYSPLANSKWVLFGDSLTDTYGGHDRASGYFASKIANEFNMNLDNRAKSGSNIYAGGNGNYTSVSGIVMLDAYLAEIEAGATAQADYITVAFGTNTFKTDMGTNEDTSETHTSSVYGATKYFIEKIREKVPNAVLGFVLSPRQDWGNADAQKLRDLNGAREAIKTVCDEYGVPYIDMSTQSGITVDMLPDGIHIKNDQSQKLYYHAMRRFMMGL